ncbi:MAG: hypothetical protein ACOCSK_02675, partial [Rhodothermales bacterium]
MAVLSLLSEEFEQSEFESIWEVSLSGAVIRHHLRERHGTNYKSDHWLHTQLRRYEEGLGVPLFERKRSGDDEGRQGFTLALHYPLVTFYQKQHLYVTEKIKIANGAYDFIVELAGQRGHRQPFSVLLGAGSTVYHMATIFAAGSHSGAATYRLYT